MRVLEVADLSGPDAVRLGERPEPEADGGSSPSERSA